MKKLSLPTFKQETEYTCGPAALRAIFTYFDKSFTEKEIETFCQSKPWPIGTDNDNMSKAPSLAGLFGKTEENASIETLAKYIDRGIPVLVNFIDVPQKSGHFATLVGYTDTELIFNDPWNGPDYALPKEGFYEIWRAENEPKKGWLLAISDKEIA
mgnify:CR=1 FL=1